MLSEFIEAIEAALNKKAVRELLPMQPGDVPSTFADVCLIASSVGYHPQVPVREGVARFVQGYRDYAGGNSGEFIKSDIVRNILPPTDEPPL